VEIHLAAVVLFVASVLVNVPRRPTSSWRATITRRASSSTLRSRRASRARTRLAGAGQARTRPSTT